MQRLLAPMSFKPLPETSRSVQLASVISAMVCRLIGPALLQTLSNSRGMEHRRANLMHNPAFPGLPRLMVPTDEHSIRRTLYSYLPYRTLRS